MLCFVVHVVTVLMSPNIVVTVLMSPNIVVTVLMSPNIVVTVLMSPNIVKKIVKCEIHIYVILQNDDRISNTNKIEYQIQAR